VCLNAPIGLSHRWVWESESDRLKNRSVYLEMGDGVGFSLALFKRRSAGVITTENPKRFRRRDGACQMADRRSLQADEVQEVNMP
jgi:hypothetical protein